ncbi:L-threonylcarbamoyladenylate synthase [Candidatus Thioglobus sp. NP1]|uniref:L-threonylcarbamoyladenylate synthase n=1 Tax=Candidatus Thioglobus sp. NP1 TaxID=2508687 RepID=UPI000DED5945|nr:L-threonylcarbamoyladenylate synthase [Candidatus Thioglobus sp. NP1]AXE61739.1 threonylcarbamoyl-AMP synthase [Candidatus Thioglobus sp. NP1]
MSKVLSIHPENPQYRLIKEVVDLLENGGIIAYPTDSGYALGCALGNKNAMDQIINIRKLRKHHHFTLMMKDLSHIGEYAKLNNSGFRLLKKILPGAYTFILEGTKDIPNRLLNGKRKTIGIRVSSNPVVQSILENLMEPMMSVSLKIEGYEFYNSNDVKEVLHGSNALIIDSGHCPPEPTTIIDLSNDEVLVLRNGNGSLEFVT